MTRALGAMAGLSLLLSGAIFGFFYAWVCSTMWGLDAADPRVAIAAMQAMNASVRNMVFAPAFFGTPFVLLATAMLARRLREWHAAMAFAAAGMIYFCGALILTMSVNVPMNEALASVTVPAEQADAARVWADYSGTWQFWNVLRTLVSGITLLLTGLGIWLMRPARQSASRAVSGARRTAA